MYQYKLTKIALNDGSEFVPGKITIIIGPNNSGKSRALKDLATQVSSNRASPTVLVKNAEWTKPNALAELLDNYPFLNPTLEPNRSPSFSMLLPELHERTGSTIAGNWPSDVEAMLQHSNSCYYSNFASVFGKAMVSYFTTERRLLLLKEASSLNSSAETCLMHALYNAGQEKEKAIRQLVKDAFGQEFFTDYTGHQSFLVRVGEDFSKIPADPREARPLVGKYEKLDDQGDGLRSFVGLMVALLIVDRPLVIIDEPELFLHPPQAYRLGAFIGTQVTDQRQIVLASHSTDILRGILSTTRDVSILRITRLENTNSFRRLDPDRINELVTDPLLSSARVLDGLFYSAAVAVEADSDARFYHSISNQLKPNLDLHFVNADNKQTVPRITKVYQDMGVHCAGIVDFDVLNDRVEFKKQLQALDLEENLVEEACRIQEMISISAKDPPANERLVQTKKVLAEMMQAIDAIQNTVFSSAKDEALAKERALKGIEGRCREVADPKRGWKLYKQKGRAALPADLKLKFDRVWEICAGKGLFINPYGELESMLIGQGIDSTTDKRGWITKALRLIPSLAANDKVPPWNFVKAIHDYLLVTTRLK